MSIFGVFLVRIFPHSDWIRTRKTPNTDTFHAVLVLHINNELKSEARQYQKWAQISIIYILARQQSFEQQLYRNRTSKIIISLFAKVRAHSLLVEIVYKHNKCRLEKRVYLIFILIVFFFTFMLTLSVELLNYTLFY